MINSGIKVRGQHRAERGAPRPDWQSMANGPVPVLPGRAAVGCSGYIGRVGALAVALGVGFAVATSPGIAWADPNSETNTAPDPGPQAPAPEGPAASEGPEPEPEPDPEPEPVNDSAPRAGDNRPDPKGPAEEPAESESESVETLGGDGPTVIIRHQGGGGKGGDEPEPQPAEPEPEEDSPGGESTPDTPAGKGNPLSDSTTNTTTNLPLNNSNRPPGLQPFTKPVLPKLDATAPPSQLHTQSETLTSFTTGANTDLVPVTGRQRMALTQDSTTLDAPSPPQRTPLQSSVAIPRTFFQVATGLLNAVLAPFVGPAPTTPQPDPPLLWAVLAFVRRQFANKTPNITETVGTPDVDGNIKITLNASDADGDRLQYTATGAVKGTLTPGADGHSFTYDPTNGATGTDTVTITASDATDVHLHGLFGFLRPGGGHTATKQLTLAIATPPTPPNQPPTVTLPAPGTLTPGANGDVVFTISGTDPDGGPVTFSAATTQGSVSTITSDSFRYTPGEYAHTLAADGYTGPFSATITVTATDSAGDTTTSTLTVPVTPKNTPPAPTGAVTVGAPNPVDGAVPISFPVSDADHDTLTFTDDSIKGDVAMVNGQLAFVPTDAARHAAAADTATAADKQAVFTITANDGHGGTTSTMVTVDIAPIATPPTPPNQPPTVTLPAPGTLTPGANGDVVFTISGTDPDGGPVTFSAATTQGSVSTITSDSFRYTPGEYAHTLAADGYTGPFSATITVTATDSAGDTTTSTLTVPVTPKNTPPAPTGAVTVGAPNPVDGAVPISFPVSDADHDTLTFTDDSIKGDVAMVNGQLAFLPTDAARHAAAADTATAADKQAVFTITANDGHGGTTSTMVTVDIASSGVVGTVPIPGGAAGAPQFFADGTRAIQTTRESTYADGVSTNTTRVVVIDTATGTQIGTTTTLTGLSTDDFGERFTPALLSADGTRAVQTTLDSPLSNGIRTYTTRVAVIDTTTGTQIGDTTVVAGSPGGTQYAADGTRIVQTTSGYDDATGAYATRVAVIDTVTGTQVGTTTALAGYSRGTQLSADGTRVVQTAQESIYDNTTSTYTYTTRVAVIDVTTGVQVGSTTTSSVTQNNSGGTQFTADGTRAIHTTQEETFVNGWRTYTTRVAVVDTATGAQVGTTTTLAGYSHGTRLSADGTRAVQTTSEETYANGVYTDTTRVAVIDTATGTQIGDTTVVAGSSSGTQLSADGTRAVQSTADTAYNTTTGVYTYTSRVAVIDTATGTQIGTTTALAGYSGATQLNADGTRAVSTSGHTTTRPVPTPPGWPSSTSPPAPRSAPPSP